MCKSGGKIYVPVSTFGTKFKAESVKVKGMYTYILANTFGTKFKAKRVKLVAT